MKNLIQVFLKIFLMVLSLSWGDKVIGMQGPEGEDGDLGVTQRANIPGDHRELEDMDEGDVAAGKDRKESAASAASGQTVSTDGYEADGSYPPSTAGSRTVLESDQPIKLRWAQTDIFTSDTLSAETITPQFRSAVEALMKILYDDFVGHKKNKLRKGRRFLQSGARQEETTGDLYRDSESEEEEMADAIKGAVVCVVGTQSLKPGPFKNPIPHIIHTLIQMMQGPGVPEALLFVVRDYDGIIGSRREIRPFISQFVGTAASSRYSAGAHGISIVGLLDE